MLVIMKYGDVQEFLQAFLNFKTARGGNVFQVNPSESRSDTHNRLNDLVRILCVQADRKGVDAAEFFEEDSFSLHDRHGSQRADIAKSKDCAAIGNNGNGIRLDCVFISSIRILGNHLTWLSHARCVCESQILS